MAETADGGRYPGASHHPPDGAGVGACAERVAVWAARAATGAPIVCLALWIPAAAGHHPCGTCLQVLQELAPGARLVMQRGDGPARRLDLAELLPDAFVSYRPAPPPSPAGEDPTP
jgi:cytidine deaminase